MYEADTVGDDIINNMIGQSVFGYSYKRKHMVINMNHKFVECTGETFHIDNQLLFQRLLTIASRV